MKAYFRTTAWYRATNKALMTDIEFTDIIDDVRLEYPTIIGAGAGVTGIEIATTYAAISTSTAIRFVYVLEDEVNNGDKSLYLYTGTTLQLLITAPLYVGT